MANGIGISAGDMAQLEASLKVDAFKKQRALQGLSATGRANNGGFSGGVAYDGSDYGAAVRGGGQFGRAPQLAGLNAYMNSGGGSRFGLDYDSNRNGRAGRNQYVGGSFSTKF